MKLTQLKMAQMINRPKNLVSEWKRTNPALFEIVQLGCEAKLKQEQCKKDSVPTQTI